MKNKTIQILAEGIHKLPVGAVVTHHMDGCKNDFEIEDDGDNMVDGSLSVYSVNYDELPPLYPTKGMNVPEEGVEFADENGRLFLVGEFGIACVNGALSNKDSMGDEISTWEHISKNLEDYELKRTLPKTITVCAGGCFKEVCECVREAGYYFAKRKVDNKEGIVCFNKETRLTMLLKNNSVSLVHINDLEVYWKNPINVIPEGEK